MENLKKLFREKFKKSDALKDLKELSTTISLEKFVEFSNMAILDAYKSNRVKAVEYILDFYEKDKLEPNILLRIHLARMLSDDKKCEQGKKMLVPLVKHSSEKIINQIMDKFMKENSNNNKSKFQLREKEINKIILENTLPQDNKVTAKNFKL